MPPEAVFVAVLVNVVVDVVAAGVVAAAVVVAAGAGQPLSLTLLECSRSCLPT